MNYGEIKKNDIANGEGVRTSLFVSGCRHHCKNCFNEVAWDFHYGNPFTEETMKAVLESCRPDYVTGLSLLGGEPMEEENQKALLPFLSKVRERCPDKNIWIYSGFTFEEILGKVKSRAFTPISRRILELCDVLVDGRFIIEEKDISLQFRGSRNQRIIDLKPTFEKGEIVLWKDSFSS